MEVWELPVTLEAELVQAYDKSHTINSKKWPKFLISVKFGSRVKKFIGKN